MERVKIIKSKKIISIKLRNKSEDEMKDNSISKFQ